MQAALEGWEAFWASMRPVELTVEVEQIAGAVAAEHGLRGADALHLASALELDLADLTVAVWDRRLHAGVIAAGLAAAPAALDWQPSTSA